MKLSPLKRTVGFRYQHVSLKITPKAPTSCKLLMFYVARYRAIFLRDQTANMNCFKLPRTCTISLNTLRSCIVLQLYSRRMITRLLNSPRSLTAAKLQISVLCTRLFCVGLTAYLTYLFTNPVISGNSNPSNRLLKYIYSVSPCY